MKMKYPLVIVSVFVASIVLVAMLPNFIGASYTTEERTNDNAGWVRFNYSTGTTATINVTIDGGNITLGGSAPQTGPADDMIIWADNNLSVYVKDGSAHYIGNNNGTVSTGTLSDNFTISKLSNGVRITDNGTAYNFPVSYWAYIPNANGIYTSFINGDDSHINDNNMRRIFVGGLLDIVTYNNTNTHNYDLTMEILQSGDILSGADWISNAPPVSLSKKITEREEILEPIRSMPTPTYTDGVWGYDLDADNNAIIVSYSGTAGDITVPATVGGYTVTTLGKGGNGENVFNLGSSFTVTISPGISTISPYAFSNNLTLITVNIPDSVNSIGRSAFYGCSALTSVNIPYGVTSIPDNLFYNCFSLQSITIPDSVTSIGAFVFRDCTALTSIIIPPSVTSIGTNAFISSSISEVLNLSGLTIDGNSYGLNDATIYTDVPGWFYISNVYYSVSSPGSGVVFVLLRLIPVFLLIGLLIYITHRVRERDNYE